MGKKEGKECTLAEGPAPASAGNTRSLRANGGGGRASASLLVWLTLALAHPQDPAKPPRPPTASLATSRQPFPSCSQMLPLCVCVPQTEVPHPPPFVCPGSGAEPGTSGGSVQTWPSRVTSTQPVHVQGRGACQPEKGAWGPTPQAPSSRELGTRDELAITPRCGTIKSTLFYMWQHMRKMIRFREVGTDVCTLLSMDWMRTAQGELSDTLQ